MEYFSLAEPKHSNTAYTHPSKPQRRWNEEKVFGMIYYIHGVARRGKTTKIVKKRKENKL
jgi:hypothetical protein